jgi:hypothetical protein
VLIGKVSETLPPEFKARDNDIVGKYFEVSFKHGEDIRIFYEIGGERIYHYHSFIDGLGGLLHIFQKKGITLISTPKIRSANYSLFKKIFIFWEWIKSQCRGKALWIGRSTESVGEKTLFKGHFNKVELEKARKKAKSLGVTINTLFVHYLNCCLKKHVTTPGNFTWAIPVSKRKDLTYNITAGNDVWFIDALIPNDDIHQLHEKLNRLYGDVDAFGGLSLKLLNSMKLFFGPLISLLRKLKLDRNATFSNLGSFEGVENTEVYFCPPCSTLAPFAVGCVTYNGLCTFTFLVEPSLPFRNEHLEKIFKDFKTSILLM